MRRARGALRKIALTIVAIASIAGAAALIWMFVTRDGVSTLSTVQLLAMLALFLLPGATYAAWELDRRAVREQGSVGEEDGGESTLEAGGLFERPEGIEVLEDEGGLVDPVLNPSSLGPLVIPGKPAEEAGPGRSADGLHRRRRRVARHDAGSGR